MNPPRTGRPPVDDPRVRTLTVRLTVGELAEVAEAAQREGLLPGVFGRVAVLARARAGQPEA